MKEIWRDIVGYKGQYQVSNLGRVKSLYINNYDINTKTFKKIERERILKPHDNKKGYLIVKLNKKSCKVHRLVAEAFIPNPNNLPQVNHKDENKENNRASNLEFCTNKYNARYSHSKPVLQYDLEGNFIKEWSCIKEAHETLNISDSKISFCCKHKKYNNTAGGFRWEYKKV